MRRARSWIVLCDTNGGTLPEDVYRIVTEVKAKLPAANLGIHAHNDTEQAVAVSLAAVRGGVRQIQGTLNGLGERCGNANLCAMLPNADAEGALCVAVRDRRCRPTDLKQLTHVSRLLDEILNRAPNRHAAYVGPSAFAHKGGLHVSAVLKDPRTYEHVHARKRSATSASSRCRTRRDAPTSGAAGACSASMSPRPTSASTRLLEDVKSREFLRLCL